MTPFELLDALTAIRQQRGITDTQIAHRMGLSIGSVKTMESRFRHHRYVPNLDTVCRYAQALGVELQIGETRRDRHH